MISDQKGQTLVALASVIGSFAVLIIYAILGKDPPPATMTLVTAVMTGVSGFYFGARGAITAMTATHDAAIKTLETGSVTATTAATLAGEQTAAGAHISDQ